MIDYVKLAICIIIVMIVNYFINPNIVISERNFTIALIRGVIVGFVLYGGSEIGLDRYYRKRAKDRQK
jgi:hypothetical protein